jgi:hypothetical protein
MKLYPKKTMRLSLASLGAISAIASLWYFYLFVQFRNPEGMLDPQGGTLYLWLTIAAASVACVVAAFLFFSAANHDREEVNHIAYYGQAHE